MISAACDPVLPEDLADDLGRLLTQAELRLAIQILARSEDGASLGELVSLRRRRAVFEAALLRVDANARHIVEVRVGGVWGPAYLPGLGACAYRDGDLAHAELPAIAFALSLAPAEVRVVVR